MSHVKEYLCHLFDLLGQIDKPTICTHAKKKDILIYLVAINALSVILNGLYYITTKKKRYCMGLEPGNFGLTRLYLTTTPKSL